MACFGTLFALISAIRFFYLFSSLSFRYPVQLIICVPKVKQTNMQARKSTLKTLFTLILLVALSGVIIVCATYLYLSPKLPSVDVLQEAKFQVPLRIYSQNGKLMGEFGEKLRTPIKKEQVPSQFINAILSAEDDRFLQHQGVDMAGLLRAALQLFASGKIQSGGSTITMQVARNFFLSSEKTFLRKFNEIFLAIQIEQSLSKDQILELYMNKIYLGKRAYGVQAAAQVYYGKPINKLNLAQLAMIAGLPKAPSAYNPINNPQRALIRRNWILGRMNKLGFISEEEQTLSTSQPVTARYHGTTLELEAGHAAEIARNLAVEKLGRNAYTDGFTIKTTINSHQQILAQQAVENGLYNYDLRHGHRGPEQTFPLDQREQWPSMINQLQTINGLRPAVIISFSNTPKPPQAVSNDAPELHNNEEQSPSINPQNYVHLLLPDNQNIVFLWNKKTNPLRVYITENKRGPAVNNLAELFKPGDVIRIKTSSKSQDLFITQIPDVSASLIAIQPNEGAISALIGGFDFRSSKFNRATQAHRQTGSNLKPFIYAAALESGFTAATLINDAPIVFSDQQLESDWRPQNSGGTFSGPTTIRQALYKSKNLVSIRLLQELGIGNAIRYLDRFTFNDRPLPRDLSLALGSYAMTPLQLATAYSSIANGGYKVTPYLVDEILDRDGKVIFKSPRVNTCIDCFNTRISANVDNQEFKEADSLDALLSEKVKSGEPAKRIMDARVVYIIDSILKDAIQKGTARKAKVLGRSDLAGKTGTTNGPTDAWFSGYHPDLVVTTWLGFDNNQNIGTREYGGSAALPIWIDFMRGNLDKLDQTTAIRPSGMVSVKIDSESGLIANELSKNTRFELFLEEHSPQPTSTILRASKPKEMRINEELF